MAVESDAPLESNLIADSAELAETAGTSRFSMIFEVEFPEGSGEESGSFGGEGVMDLAELGEHDEIGSLLGEDSFMTEDPTQTLDLLRGASDEVENLSIYRFTYERRRDSRGGSSAALARVRGRPDFPDYLRSERSVAPVRDPEDIEGSTNA